MKLSFFLAWYDGWIGYFYDRDKKALYIAPFPWCIIKIERRP